MEFEEIFFGGLSQTFFGNELWRFVLMFCTILLFLIAGRVLYFVFENYLKKMAAKTKTNIDDIIIKASRGPAILIVILLGFYLGLRFMAFPENVGVWFSRIVSVFTAAYIAYVVISVFNSVLDRYLLPRARMGLLSLDDQMLMILRRSVKILVILFTALFLLNNFGVNVTSLLAGLGIGGLAVALAAKDTLSNIFGSIMIMTDRPFKVGSYIKVKGNEGTVREIGLRSTRLRTLAGTSITIPNSIVAQEAVEDMTRYKEQRSDMTVCIDIATKPEKVEEAVETVKAIVNTVKGINTEKTAVYLSRFNTRPGSIELQVFYWWNAEHPLSGVKHEIHTKILKEFERRGIRLV